MDEMDVDGSMQEGAERGPASQAKAQARRGAVIDSVADFLLAEGLRSASLRRIAAAAGLSDRMLLYYFPDKEAVVAAALQRAAERLAVRLGDADATARPPDELEAALLALTGGEAIRPFMALWLEVAAFSARGEPLYKQIGKAIASGFVGWIEARLDLPEPGRACAARRLLVIVEGEALLRSVGL